MQRILVGVDMTEASLRAVDLAADLAAKYGAELVLLTVVGESMGEDLAIVRDRATGKGASYVSTDVYVGDPAEQILACADARQVDLIVVGSRGHRRLAGLLLGSVARKVVALAHCPVLVVH
jgi:nucleotide-binding universal stress UspA family protein